MRFPVYILLLLASGLGHTAITFVEQANNVVLFSTPPSTGVTVSVPTGTQDDDFMVAHTVIDQDGGVCGTVSGWTLQSELSGAEALARDITACVYTRVAVSEPASYTFTGTDTNNEEMSATIYSFRGVDGLDVTPAKASHYGTYQNDSTPTQPNITTLTDGAVVVILSSYGTDDLTDCAPPTNYTEMGQYMGGSYDQVQSCTGYREIATAGAQTIGNWQNTASPSNATEGIAATLALRPAATDTDPPVYTVAPAVSTKTSTSVTFSATATDATGPIDHYFAAYADGSTPTAANVKGAAGTGFVTSSNDSDLDVTSGNAASVTSGANLTADTAYEGCMVAEDDAANLQASATCVGFTTLPAVDGIPILVEDAFTDTNGTSIASHTPDTDEIAGGWSIEDIWTGQSAGTATIQSNTLELADQTAAIIDVGTPNMVFDVDYVAESGGNVGIPVRWVDGANWWKCQYIPNTNQLRLQKRIADVTTNFDTQAFSFTTSQTYRLTGFANGNNIGCAIDGVPKVFVTDSALSTSTKGGVSADNDTTGPRFDNLTALQSFQAVNPNTGDVADDPKGFFLGQSRQAGDVYWMDPDDLVDNAPVTQLLYYGGSFYIAPQTDFAGETQWGLELYDSALDTINTTSHTHTTVETSPGVAPVFNDVDCALKSNAYEVNVNPGATDFSGCLTTIGQPSPTFEVTVGTVPTGRVFDDPTGVESGTPTTTTGSPFSYTITATNATGSDTLAVTSTVSAQAGNAPVCAQLPTYYVEVGDSVTFSLADHCSGATSYSCGALADGLTQTGAGISGVVTTAQFRETNCTISNSAGTVFRVWRQEVWPAGSLCGDNPIIRAARAIVPAIRKPIRHPAGSPLCRQF